MIVAQQLRSDKIQAYMSQGVAFCVIESKSFYSCVHNQPLFLQSEPIIFKIPLV
jgi:hypothetical protein